MSSLKEVRKLTGLSQARMAAWLGVSKSLVQFVENGDRSLPAVAALRLNAMMLLAYQVKKPAEATRPGESIYTNPAKLASLHKRKMDFHLRSAAALGIKLGKLKALHPQLNVQLAVFDALKNAEMEWYQVSERDKTWIKLTEFFSKKRIPSTGLEEQELLQDKIDLHLSYAEVHKYRWGMFLEMEVAG